MDASGQGIYGEVSRPGGHARSSDSFSMPITMKNSGSPPFCTSAVCCAALSVVTLLCHGAQTPPGSSTRNAAMSPSRTAGQTPPPAGLSVDRRQREGTTLVSQYGHFEHSGDRLLFTSIDGTLRVTALENLALQRIGRLINEQSAQLEWSISGTLTEYRGGNYLLITRAMVKSASRHTADLR